MKNKVKVTHFIIYLFSITITLGGMSFYIYLPHRPKVDLNAIFRQRQELIKIKKEKIKHAKKMEKVDRIRTVIKKEMRMKSDLAREISLAIYNHTKDNGISPELIIAVMKIESHGMPNAVSSAGAMGLLQVMPFWKKVMNMDDADLFDADTNIKMGVNVLHRYINRYKKLDRALAAYNGSLGSSRYPKKVLKVYKKIVAENANEV